MTDQVQAQQPTVTLTLTVDQVNNIINADENAGNALGVDATPTFYLNSKKIQVNNSVQDFSKLIDAALASSTASK